MKNIICLMNNNISWKKKQEFLEDLKCKISALQLPFTIDIYSENNFYNFLDYHYAILCFPPKNILPKFEKLEFILTTNVGYDDFMDETKNFTIPIGRLIYPPAISRMCDYVLYCVLDYILLMDKHRNNQFHKVWDRTSPFSLNPGNICIGIMGLSNVGLEIANILDKNNKQVIGYSQTRKKFPIENYTKDELDIFLSKSNILVNTLPLTAETKSILNIKTLQKLPDHSCLINIARGGHVIEEDLLVILETDKLKKAYLDVFNIEPLPKDHPFWVHPKILITSHISGAFDLLNITDLIIHQCQLFYEKSFLLYPINYEI